MTLQRRSPLSADTKCERLEPKLSALGTLPGKSPPVGEYVDSTSEPQGDVSIEEARVFAVARNTDGTADRDSRNRNEAQADAGGEAFRAREILEAGAIRRNPAQTQLIASNAPEAVVGVDNRTKSTRRAESKGHASTKVGLPIELVPHFARPR